MLEFYCVDGVGNVSVGLIVSFLQLSKTFIRPINQVSQQLNSVVMALAGAKRIFAFTTFGLFVNGLKSFDDAYEKGIIDKIFTTNLIYGTDELLSRDWYQRVDMSKYIAYLIDTLNHDNSISELLNPVDRVNNILKKYNQK